MAVVVSVVVVTFTFILLTSSSSPSHTHTFTEARLRKANGSRNFFTSSRNTIASFTQSEPVPMSLSLQSPPIFIPVPSRSRFRRSDALMRAAKTVEEMVKVMDDKKLDTNPNDPLRTELVLLSQEIQSTLTPEENPLINTIQDNSRPTLNNPREPEGEEGTEEGMGGGTRDGSDGGTRKGADEVDEGTDAGFDVGTGEGINDEDTGVLDEGIDESTENSDEGKGEGAKSPDEGKDEGTQVLNEGKDDEGTKFSEEGTEIRNGERDNGTENSDEGEHEGTEIRNGERDNGTENSDEIQEKGTQFSETGKDESTQESPYEGNRNTAAQTFLLRVKEILEGSGIELVLPVDCGRNPLQPNDQLNTTQLPWLVALGSREDGRFFYRCPGLVITNFHVLTDADCTASPSITVVHVSRSDSGQIPDEEAEENFVVGRRIHPEINTLNDLFYGVNLGLLELAEPFLFRDDLQPVCLPGLLEEPDPFTAFNGVIAGYNLLKEPTVTTPGGASRDAEVFLKEASVYGPAWCRSGVLSANGNPNNTAAILRVLNENHVCASIDFEEIGKSVLLVEDGRTGRVRVMGVGAFANTVNTFPVVYTLVQPHRFWVEVTLKRFLDNTASHVILEETEDEQR